MNYKKLGIGIVSVATVFSLLIIISAPKEQNVLGSESIQDSKNPITTEMRTYDFGTISMKKGTVSYTYTIKNESLKKVKITKVETSCMCTKATLITKGEAKFGPFGMSGHGGSVAAINVQLLPQETADIEVVFDPAAHGSAGIGKINRSIFIQSAENPNLELTFSANVTP